MCSWHEWSLRARYEETDAMQVVYYVKVLVWMEVGLHSEDQLDVQPRSIVIADPEIADASSEHM
jgi:hypothetical protein